MTQSTGNKNNPSASNRRLGFILLTVVVIFFVGIYAKKVLLG
ncbi:cytochrome oxidase small assembly protein [Polynucleobacter sp. MWH-Spelu-300-X4]|nr:cytochrome oxidase small assembly protein [Polynucleobacter sp. MWH-Spelu-300-X4]